MHVEELTGIGLLLLTAAGFVSRYRATRPKITIGFGHSSAFDPNSPNSPMRYVLTINIINRGQTSEFIQTVWLEDAAHSRGVDVKDHLTEDLELKPRARIPLRAFADDLPGCDRGFVATVTLASGIKIVSRVEHLIDGLIDAEDAVEGGA